MNYKCFAANCADAPTHAAGVRLWLRYRRGTPAEVVTSLFTCGPHSLQLTPADVMTDAAWVQFAGQFRRQKGAAPDRNLNEVFVLPLDHPRVVELVAQIEAQREHLGLKDEWEDVTVACARCGLEGFKVRVRVRGSNEHVTHYMEMVQAWAWRAHAVKSPACRAEKLTAVEVPAAAMGWSEDECRQHFKESRQ